MRVWGIEACCTLINACMCSVCAGDGVWQRAGVITELENSRFYVCTYKKVGANGGFTWKGPVWCVVQLQAKLQINYQGLGGVEAQPKNWGSFTERRHHLEFFRSQMDAPAVTMDTLQKEISLISHSSSSLSAAEITIEDLVSLCGCLLRGLSNQVTLHFLELPAS